MIEFIPLEFYSGFFYNVLLIASLMVLLSSTTANLDDGGNLRAKQQFGMVMLGFCVLFIGLRPVSGKYFGDMRVYASIFEKYAEGESVISEKDVYFQLFMKWSSGVMTMGTFFFICALLYILPLYVFSKRMFREYWFYGFFALLISFSFWSFGVNGIRNGISTSMFLLAMSYKKTRDFAIALLLAIGAHRSALIVMTGWLITSKFKNPKLALTGWMLAIPVSLVMGSFWESFFLKFGFGEEERLQGYLGGTDEVQQEEASGFRWDFILYSGMGVFAGWFFILKKKFEDAFYTRLYIFYLIMNAFWILVIRAAFSNRFAYLSWFVLGVVIVYPMLKVKFFQKQHQILAGTLFFYFLVTYMLNFVMPRL